MSNEDDNNDPKIYIIPDFKELSRNLESFNQHSKSCGYMGNTNENCIGDYDENNKKMIRRANYHKNTDKSPNHFLHKDPSHFEIVKNTQGFTINKYMDNWELLFKIIINIIDTQPNSSSPIEKYNVFISGHQHLFQKMFFNFMPHTEKDDKCKQTIEGYGFRNCTCIKISKKNDASVEIKVVYSNNSGRDKFKYKYIDEGEILTNYLVENTYPTNKINKINSLLDKCDIYMIRHGEAVHNLKDVIDTLKIKETCDKTGANSIRETNGDKEIIKKLKKNKSLYRTNAQLTTQGLIQADDLYNALYVGYSNSFMNKTPPIIDENNKNIYISSPMDRTIETLIYATSGKASNKFDDLKQKFMKMRLDIFPITYQGLTNDKLSTDNRFTGYSDKNFQHRDTMGGKRKTRRKINKRSRRKTNKVKKTRKTKKRYQKGCARK